MNKAFLLISFFSLSSFAFVNYQSASGGVNNVFEGPGAVALGGAGLAAKSYNESGHLNPATLPLLDGTHFGFIYGSESVGPRAGTNKYHIVLTEATDEVMFPGALSYSKVGAFRDGKDISLQEIHGAIGFDISDFVSSGLALKYQTVEGQNTTQVSGFNGTLGVLVAPIRDLGLALVYDDFLDEKDIPVNSTLGFGAQYVFHRVLRLRADAVLPQKDNPGRNAIYKTGFESLFLGKDANVRAGYRWDNFRSQRFFTAGIGWQGPRLGLNYAYEKNSETDDFRHLIDMLLQF